MLVGINSIALLVFIGAYFVLSDGRKVDSIESGWTGILFGLGLLVILLAVVPLRFGHSTLSMVFSGFFAVLPSIIALGFLLSNILPTLKKEKTFAETYYKEKQQIAIASAIENNDTTLLKELIKGQDLNIQGIRVWDWDGLNYLQFAVRLRSNSISFPVNDATNLAAIRILLANGCDATPALAEGVKCLPLEVITEFITAGADPNTRGFVNPNPLIFELIGSSKEQNDLAILLVKKGANVNAKNENGFTPVMFAAYSAGTSPQWNDTWRLVRYLLEEANADYTAIGKNNENLANIIKKIREKATTQKTTMPTDFDKVVEWLKQHKVDTSNL
jgi:hypothetical protein